jgi:hypothetical protein
MRKIISEKMKPLSVLAVFLLSKYALCKYTSQLKYLGVVPQTQALNSSYWCGESMICNAIYFKALISGN